jgi:crotonobetainyl-CoA:carnitine CoA-transferase CaiB-like acyl-CoA transferase
MLEATVNIAAQTLLEHDAYGIVLGRSGNRSSHAAPQGVYQCADGRWLAVSVVNDIQWRALLTAVGWADDDGLASRAGRQARHDELDRRLAEWAASRNAEDGAAALFGAGVPAAPCRDPAGSAPILNTWPADSSNNSTMPSWATTSYPAPRTGSRRSIDGSTGPRRPLASTPPKSFESASA